MGSEINFLAFFPHKNSYLSVHSYPKKLPISQLKSKLSLRLQSQRYESFILLILYSTHSLAINNCNL